MMVIFTVFALSFLPALWCLPYHENPIGSNDVNFIGRGTNEIATALLQGFVTKDDNMAYSPFGYSAILAVFSEGARGESREEISTALHFPENVEAVRLAYKHVIEGFVKFSNSPEFKNWFYIYKNYTVSEELQSTLRNYYLTEVKYVERPEDLINNVKKRPIPDVVDNHDKKVASDVSEAPVEESFVAEDDGSLEANENPIRVSVQFTSDVESEKPTATTTSQGEAEIKKGESDAMEKNTTGNAKEENSSTGETKKDEGKKEEDTHVTSQPVQKVVESNNNNNNNNNNENVKPLGSEEQMKVAQKLEAIEQNEDKMEDKMKGIHSESKEEDKKQDDISTDSKVSSFQKSETKSEITKPLEKEVPVTSKKSKSQLMSMDHLSGMTDSAIKVKGKDTEPQMIIFNGLYYKGQWETPFEKKPADGSRVFYKSENKKILVPTIHSEGFFNTGSIQTLDCSAIELPYKGGRYSLLILVPNSRDGLTKLIADLSGYPLSNVYDHMTEKLVDVSLPCFEVNTISKPTTVLKKLGINKVNKIFDPDTADLSGISQATSGLYVEELVQMVTFKVEAEYSKANFLTASIAASRSNVQNFQVNQPFLFYLRDKHADLTIVNGKVVDPTPKPTFYFS